MLICGTGAADTIPNRYLLNFNASGILQPGSAPVPVATATAATPPVCSPVTEYFNPHLSPPGTDFFFWGVTKNCAGHAAGCVMALTNETTLTTVGVSGGTSGIIIDNDYVTLGGGSSIAYGINGLGQVVGFADPASGSSQACLFGSTPQQNTALGTLGGSGSTCKPLARVGDLAGTWIKPSPFAPTILVGVVTTGSSRVLACG